MKIPEDMPYRGPSPFMMRFLKLLGLSFLMAVVIDPMVTKVTGEMQPFLSVWSISIEVIIAASIARACLRILEDRR